MIAQMIEKKEEEPVLGKKEGNLLSRLKFACRGLEETSPEELLQLTCAHFYEGIKDREVDFAMLFAARSKIESDPAYSKAAARLLLDVIYRETMGTGCADPYLMQRH